MKNYFEGYYFKHQGECDNKSVAFIPGVSREGGFLQVVTAEKAYWFTAEQAKNCKFSKRGASLDVKTDEVTVRGKIRYGGLTPLKYDIMGPFKYFPMECRHGIISMGHGLNGYVAINNRIFNFNNGLGYIEKDCGVSFPQSYLWAQCNFNQGCSVSLAVADIPFAGLNFKGCICVIYYNNKQYRLATYLGVKAFLSRKGNIHRVILRQGRYTLILSAAVKSARRLPAPRNGRMSRTITESLECPMRVRFYKRESLLFDLSSNKGSLEAVDI